MIKKIDWKTATPALITYKKTTPKQYASETLASAIDSQLEFFDGDEFMTEREKNLVLDQLVKYKKRLYKVLESGLI